MRNTISGWTAGIGYCLFAIVMPGCGSPESGSAVTPSNAPAARTQVHGERDSHEHADGAHEHGKDAHGHEGHGHDEHEGHAHEQAGAGGLPADFASAVAELRPMYEVIRNALQAGDRDKADRPLHQVGHVLESLPELAGKAGLGGPELAIAKSASTTMFEAYGKIDEAIHAGQQPDYKSVAAALDKAIAELSELANPPADPK